MDKHRRRHGHHTVLSRLVIIRDVTAILNHWDRDTLDKQLEAILTASVLPRQVKIHARTYACAHKRHKCIYTYQGLGVRVRFQQRSRVAKVYLLINPDESRIGSSFHARW